MSKGAILIVDDSSFVLSRLEAYFKDKGFFVITASTGFEAIQKVFNDNPDIIILDLLLPDINGFQVCRLIKNDKQTKDIPVIIFSVKDTPQDKFWGVEVGAERHLDKNIELDDLLTAVDELLQWRKEHRITRIGEAGKNELTLLDILIKVNDLLDRKLYEETVINQLVSLSKYIHNYNETAKSIINILKGIISFDMCLLTVGNNKKIDHFFFSNIKITMEDHKRLIMLILKQLLTSRDIIPQSKGVMLTPQVISSSQNTSLDFEDESKRYVFTIKPHTPEAEIVCGFLFYGENIKRLDEVDRSKLAMILESSSIVIENSFLFKNLKELSVTDEMTMLYNRRHFLQLLDTEYFRVKRNNGGFAVIILDIDKFKEINDQYGEMVGDHLLEKVAYILKQNTRKSDMIARFGGDEFAILAPNISLEKAQLLGNKLHNLINNSQLVHGGESLNVSVSIGISYYESAMKWRPEEIVNYADLALYEAQQKGGNRVVVFKEEDKSI